MDLPAARTLATSLMAQHGVDWDFKWDRAKKRAGQTNFTTRTVTLSGHLTKLCTEEQVRQTVLHEIAHVLVGPGHGHGPVWQKKAKEIGADPKRSTGPDFPKAPAPWQATCPAGHVHYRYRKPTRPVSCGLCSRTFSERHLLTWRKVTTQ
ncbi:SprT-like domain-containing protein [Flaviflexus sp.]|uniref:SprT-like domain-containing protein n=1 Tax=Flaviflexus sp. TaxID=1969482 RepID=UPI00352C8BC9